MPRIEPPLGRRPHDAQSLSVECGRTGAILQVREQRLLATMHRERRGRHRDVLWRRGTPAGLCVKQGRFGRQRRMPGPALILDEWLQLLVVLHRHIALKHLDIAKIPKAMIVTESSIAVGGDDALQNARLCSAGTLCEALDRPPECGAVPLHAGAQEPCVHCERNGAFRRPMNVRGYGVRRPSSLTSRSCGRNQVPNSRSHTMTVLP